MTTAFEQLAEQKIEEAIANGLFDDLKGKGVKLDMDAWLATPEHLRMSHSMLKIHGYVPPEVEMMQEIFRLEKQIEAEENDRELRALEIRLTYKKTELAMAMERLKQGK